MQSYNIWRKETWYWFYKNPILPMDNLLISAQRIGSPRESAEFPELRSQKKVFTTVLMARICMVKHWRERERYKHTHTLWDNLKLMQQQLLLGREWKGDTRVGAVLSKGQQGDPNLPTFSLTCVACIFITIILKIGLLAICIFLWSYIYLNIFPFLIE